MSKCYTELVQIGWLDWFQNVVTHFSNIFLLLAPELNVQIVPEFEYLAVPVPNWRLKYGVHLLRIYCKDWLQQKDEQK